MFTATPIVTYLHQFIKDTAISTNPTERFTWLNINCWVFTCEAYVFLNLLSACKAIEPLFYLYLWNQNLILIHFYFILLLQKFDFVFKNHNLLISLLQSVHELFNRIVLLFDSAFMLLLTSVDFKIILFQFGLRHIMLTDCQITKIKVRISILFILQQDLAAIWTG